jgi:hypothetical protein
MAEKAFNAGFNAGVLAKGILGNDILNAGGGPGGSPTGGIIEDAPRRDVAEDPSGLGGCGGGTNSLPLFFS